GGAHRDRGPALPARVQPARADLPREQRPARALDRAGLDRQDPDGRGRRVPRHGAAPGDRRAAPGRLRGALAHGQRRRAADPAPAPRARDEPAGARDARRAAAPALSTPSEPFLALTSVFDASPDGRWLRSPGLASSPRSAPPLGDSAPPARMPPASARD